MRSWILLLIEMEEFRIRINKEKGKKIKIIQRVNCPISGIK